MLNAVKSLITLSIGKVWIVTIQNCVAWGLLNLQATSLQKQNCLHYLKLILNKLVICSQVLKMEHLILKVLSFDVSVPTALNFLERFVKAAFCPESHAAKVEALAKVSLLPISTSMREQFKLFYHKPCI